MENQGNNGQGFAIASLIIGIFALLLSMIPCVNFSAILIGSAAVIFGIVALSRAVDTNQSKSMSIAGISLGGMSIFIAILIWVFIVSSKSEIKDKFENFFEWAEEFEEDFDGNVDIEIEFDNEESLDNLEKALDELEGAVDDVNEEVNEAVNEVHEEVKDAIEDAKEEIEEAKEKHKEKYE